ncbi:60Kd inner membrane protein-domain-containing protein, partial [Melanogaster broomeanus]
SRLLPHSLPSRQGFSNVRNYWWSKPATPPVTEHWSPTTEPAAAASTSPFATPEQPTALASTPSDAVTQTVAAAPDTFPSPDSVSAVLPTDASIISDLSEVATNVVPALQYGDFAALGLAGWSPAGLMRWSFEVLQVSTGMPWFYTIIAGTVLWRIILIPSQITNLRTASLLRPYAAQLKALDEETGKADQRRKMELVLKKQQVYEKAGVSVSAIMINPLIQVVANVGLFLAVKEMVTLPVVQMAQSGVWFLPDLTVADPYYLMPLVVAVVTNVQMVIMKKDLDFAMSPLMPHFVNIGRVLSFAAVPLMAMLPSGLWLSVAAGIVTATLQSAVLLLPRVRQALSLAPRLEAPTVTMRDTAMFVLEWYRGLSAPAQPIPRLAVRRSKPNLTARKSRPRWS